MALFLSRVAYLMGRRISVGHLNHLPERVRTQTKKHFWTTACLDWEVARREAQRADFPRHGFLRSDGFATTRRVKRVTPVCRAVPPACAPATPPLHCPERQRNRNRRWSWLGLPAAAQGMPHFMGLPSILSEGVDLEMARNFETQRICTGLEIISW